MEPDIEGLSQAAWEAYYTTYVNRFSSRPPRIGNTPRTNKLYKAFVNIAKVCIDNKFDVRDYIVFCFERSQKQRIYITPNDFNNKTLVSQYSHFLKSNNSTSRVELDFRDQINRLARYIQLVEIYSNEKEILLCVNNPFYAWFRIFYGQVLDDELIKYYGKAAYTELHANKALRDYIRKIRPESLKAFEALFGIFGD